MLEQSATYNPNEEELKITTLREKLEEMKSRNIALIHANTEYSNTRLSRDQLLYNNLTRLCQITKEVKQYVKSVFGATSPQYKQISSLLFVKRKR